MNCAFPVDNYRDWEGLTELKAEIEDCVQDVLVKLFSRNEVVSGFSGERNVGECAEWVMKV